MALLEIVKWPNPVLENPGEHVTDFDDQLKKLVNDMFETMYAAPGVGLASVQIGVLQRVMVLDVGINEGQLIKRDPKVVINPEFVTKEGSLVWEEGCLSCPD